MKESDSYNTTATFIGENKACNFVHGTTYHVSLKQSASIFWVASDHHSCCYASLDRVFEDWKFCEATEKVIKAIFDMKEAIRIAGEYTALADGVKELLEKVAEIEFRPEAPFCYCNERGKPKRIWVLYGLSEGGLDYEDVPIRYCPSCGRAYWKEEAEE